MAAADVLRITERNIKQLRDEQARMEHAREEERLQAAAQCRALEDQIAAHRRVETELQLQVRAAEKQAAGLRGQLQEAQKETVSAECTVAQLHVQARRSDSRADTRCEQGVAGGVGSGRVHRAAR